MTDPPTLGAATGAVHEDDGVDTQPKAGRHLVVAFPLGPEALAVLADRLGRGFTVRDIRTDGPAPDIVIAPPCSPQAIGHLKQRYSGAAVVIVELEDLLRDVKLGGPVGRSLAAGADAYYVAASTEALGTFLSALPIGEPGAIKAMDQPVALTEVSESFEPLEAVRRAATPERARRPDRAPGP